ncbi:MAG: alpha/beta hydrolase domain-containing protein [SAR324 cluster bacterium]|nr:alpha/beta hydrolase domain-containing protein [SAR324 cluster bacterium]
MSIEERYQSLEEYLQQLREAGEALAQEGYLLEEDIERIAQRSAKIWEAFTS